jgi:hypothetical protein
MIDSTAPWKTSSKQTVEVGELGIKLAALSKLFLNEGTDPIAMSEGINDIMRCIRSNPELADEMLQEDIALVVQSAIRVQGDDIFGPKKKTASKSKGKKLGSKINLVLDLDGLDGLDFGED